MDTVIWVQILDEPVCISLRANALGKYMNNLFGWYKPEIQIFLRVIFCVDTSKLFFIRYHVLDWFEYFQRQQMDLIFWSWFWYKNTLGLINTTMIEMPFNIQAKSVSRKAFYFFVISQTLWFVRSFTFSTLWSFQWNDHICIFRLVGLSKLFASPLCF